MVNCFLKLDKRRALKDGTFPVKVVVGNGTNILVSTGISVDPDSWDDGSKLYTGKDARRINSALSAVLSRVTLRLIDLKEDGRIRRLSRSQLSSILSSPDEDKAPADDKMDFFTIAEKCIKTRPAQSTRDIYELTVSKVRSFSGGHLNIEDINREWLYGFYDSIPGKINSKAIHMRNLRAICNFAIDEDLTTAYPFRKFRIKTEETRKRALTIEQLRAIRDCDVTDFQREYRDMFLLMFYLIGINASDLFTARKDDIVNGRLEYRRNKTGKLYSIKLEPEAIAIIEKYKGKDWLLSPLDRYSSYRDYLHHLNNSLKTLGQTYMTSSKKSGKVICGDLSTYWTRHTWATIAAELDIADPTISLALGHSIAGHRTTAVYIKRDAAKIDAANRAVIDYLFSDK